MSSTKLSCDFTEKKRMKYGTLMVLSKVSEKSVVFLANINYNPINNPKLARRSCISEKMGVCTNV